MTINIRETSNGRVMVESDGFCEYHNAFLTGAAVCNISAPKSIVESYTDNDGLFHLGAFLSAVKSSFWRPDGVRVHSLRYIK